MSSYVQSIFIYGDNSILKSDQFRLLYWIKIEVFISSLKTSIFSHCEKCGGEGVPVGTEVGIRTPLALSWSCLRKLWSASRSHGTRRETNISFPENRVSNLQYYCYQNSTRLNFKSVHPIKSSLNLELIINYFLHIFIFRI